MNDSKVNVVVSGHRNEYHSTYKTYILRGGIPFADQVIIPDTKYVIKYDFNLGGETIQMPAGCILKFDGGTIDNGTIVGNNTIMIYDKPIDEVCPAERQGTFIYNTTIAVDEEDITSESGQLKFKDRPATDGMGRKILRKNIVNGINTLTQSMINQANTIYVIQYDFTLGEDITVPENCVLEFDGGSVSGAYNIIGNNTGINAGLFKIFNTNIIFDGTWIIEKWFVNWWGVIGDNTGRDSKKCVTNGTDNSEKFAAIFPALINVKDPIVFFPKGNYVFSQTVEIQYVFENLSAWAFTNNIVIEGASRHGVNLIFESENAFSFRDNVHSSSLLALFIFKNLSIYCGLNAVATRYTELVNVDSYTKEGAAISVVTPIYGCKIDNVFFHNWHTAIYIKNTYGSFKISNCTLDHCIYGIVADTSNLLNIENVTGNLIYQTAFYLYNCKECVLTECLSELRPEDSYITHFRNIGFVTINSGHITFNTCYTERVYLSRYIKDSSVYEINPKINGIIRVTDTSTNTSVTREQADEITNAGITLRYSMEIDSTYNSDANRFLSSFSRIINPLMDLDTRIKCNVEVTGAAGSEKSVYYNGTYYHLANICFDIRNNTSNQLSVNTIFCNGNAVPYVNEFSKFGNIDSLNFLPSLPSQKIYGGAIVQGSAGKYFGTKSIYDILMSGVSGEEFNDCKIKGISYLFTRNGNNHNFSIAFKEITDSATNLYEYYKYSKYGIIFNRTLYLTGIHDDKDIYNFIYAQGIETLVMYGDINITTNPFSFPNNLKTVYLRGGKFINNTQNTKNVNLSSVKVYPCFSDIQSDGLSAINFNPSLAAAGTMKWDSTNNKPLWSNGTAWIDATGIIAGTLTSGIFANKPTVSANNIPVGFKYFCTDKHTTEAYINGIEIIHKGNDVWVDALGRVVS